MDFVHFIFAALILQASCWQTMAKAWLNDAEDLSTVLYQRAAPKECANNARLALSLCSKKVAKSQKEVAYCAKIFIRDFPRCFFPKSVPGSKTCTKDIWRAYGKCSTSSLSFAEQFTCRIMLSNMLRQCGKAKRQEQETPLNQEAKELFESKRDALAAKIQRAVHAAHSQDSGMNSNKFDSVLTNLIHYLGQKDQSSPVHPNNSKRTDCLSACMGNYEACIYNTGVTNEIDHNVCLSAKTECTTGC